MPQAHPALRWIVVCFCLVALPCAAARAEPRDEVAEGLGLTPQQGALPIWSEPPGSAVQELGAIVREAGPAVMIIGHPRHGHGTGFVISREHRLVATNAHVADILHRSGGSLLAISNGTAQPYRVLEVWYHPGVRRYLGGNQALIVQSTDPADGDVYPLCPDVAVLRLSADGPDLPVELGFATPADLQQLFGQPLGMLGFPGHDQVAWPAIGTEAAATYHTGVASRVTDFNYNGGAPHGSRQFVQHTMSTWGGFSGSPLFLANGRVAALNNMARYHRGQVGNVATIAHGVRIDALWEVLVHHGLEGLVPLPVDREQLDLDRWLEEDEEGKRYRRALELTARANHLIYVEEKPAEAVALCNQAIQLAPHYPEVRMIRASGYLSYVVANHQRIPRSQSLEQLRFARRDLETFIQLAPSDPRGITQLAWVSNNTAALTGDLEEYRKMLPVLNKLLDSPNLDDAHRAGGHSVRGAVHYHLGRPQQALADFNESIRLDPRAPRLWENRAALWREQGQPERAAEDARRAEQLRAELRARQQD